MGINWYYPETYLQHHISNPHQAFVLVCLGRRGSGLLCNQFLHSKNARMHTHTHTLQCKRAKDFNFQTLILGNRCCSSICVHPYASKTQKLQSVTKIWRCEERGRVWKLWQPGCFYGNSRTINCCGCWQLACCWEDQCVCAEDYIQCVCVCMLVAVIVKSPTFPSFTFSRRPCSCLSFILG